MAIDLEAGIHRLVRSEHDYTSRQLGVMFQCRGGPRTVRDLSDILNISKPAISRAADKLEEVGFMKRHADPEDRRSVLLAMTPAGEKFLRWLSG